MKGIIILDSEYLLHLCAEQKKGSYSVSDFHRFYTTEKKIYERTESDVILNGDILKGLLEDLRNESLCKLKNVDIILPHALSWYHYLEVEEYPKNQNEAVEFVMWKVQKIMPISKDSAEIRIQVLKKEKDITKLLVVASFKGFIKSLESLLVGMGILPFVMITPTLAFLNVFEKSLPKNGMVLWLREKSFSQVIFRNELPIFIREVDRALELSRIDFEIMSIISNVRERYPDFESEEIVFFDELDRIGIESYFSEKVRALSVKDRLADFKESVSFSPYICGLGVL